MGRRESGTRGNGGTTAPGGRLPGLRARLPVRPGPALLVVLGSACTSASGTFIKLSQVNAGTAAFLRCVLALLVLAPFAIAEYRRAGGRPLRLQLLDVGAGLLLGVDFVFWSQSIQDVGASIATVLLNVQLVVFPLLAVLTGARLSRGFWVTAPLMMAGVALASGALGSPEPGSEPVSGVAYGTAAGVAFAGYLFLTRLGGTRGTDRKPDGTGRPHMFLPVCMSTLGAAVGSGVLGAAWTGIDLNPGWPAWGWIVPMALFGQVLAWLLINPALPRLSPDTGATLLLLQPVLAMAIGIGALGERPTPTQYAGCVLIVLVVWRAGRRGDEGDSRPSKTVTQHRGGHIHRSRNTQSEPSGSSADTRGDDRANT
ncbi:DMT family transporter [Streptomyces sp. HNM0574]|uniref:DMT family transporter n=1 Tax=Streptomyces sp. HNM0574 TaxID=2714954 RepID=UPI00146EEB0F|nr:DMT family transporter [Streptomyces sp. HNM0574]NLU66399.1 DMT family transporter [Streptomyces sp. HNM0574]